MNEKIYCAKRKDVESAGKKREQTFNDQKILQARFVSMCFVFLVDLLF